MAIGCVADRIVAMIRLPRLTHAAVTGAATPFSSPCDPCGVGPHPHALLAVGSRRSLVCLRFAVAQTNPVPHSPKVATVVGGAGWWV